MSETVVNIQSIVVVILSVIVTANLVAKVRAFSSLQRQVALQSRRIARLERALLSLKNQPEKSLDETGVDTDSGT